MKKYYLLLAVLSFMMVCNTHSQTNIYHPFPDSNASWREMSWLSDIQINPNNPFVIYDEHIISLGGDTVIGNVHYKKLLQTGYRSCTNCNDHPIPWGFYTDSLIGALRQDTALRRVYFFNLSYSSEIILYDFNLQYGDTISDSVFVGIGGTVTSVDSILVGNNYRKRFKIGAFKGHIIEGIGSAYGLLNTMAWYIEQGSGLYCFNQDNFTYYNQDSIGSNSPFTDSSFDDCSLASGIKEIKNNVTLKIFPNPANNILYIHQTSDSDYQLIITDIIGTIMYNKTLNLIDNSVTIASWSDGMYFYEFKNKNGSSTGKFIKE